MDTSRLNKIIVILLCVFVTSCNNNKCDCEKIIGLTNGVMLSSKETRNNLKGLKIQHIRKGKIIENILYKYQYNIKTKKVLSINRTKELYITDSIKFLFKDGKVFYIHGYILEPKYRGKFFGGKEFIGCETNYCKINEIDSCYIGNYIEL